MRYFALFIAGLLLAGCASPLPPRDPALAWVNLHSSAGELLMAERLDDKRLDDGRYFQLTPGAHELLVRFQFEVAGGGGDLMGEPVQRTCEIRIRHDAFQAGQVYRLEARSMVMSAQAWLYDDQRRVLARGKVMRCGTF